MLRVWRPMVRVDALRQRIQRVSDHPLKKAKIMTLMMKSLTTTMLLLGSASVSMACDCDKAQSHGEQGKTMAMDGGCAKLLHGKDGHANHAAKGTAPAGSPVVEALEKANQNMHKDMAIAYTGDADIDMLRGMIPHHQGAVAMAEVAVKYGEDTQVRRLAMEIIRAQNLEIRWMQNYLKSLEARGVRPVPADATPRPSWSDAGWRGATWLGER
jgi:hypothetical protein